MTNTTTQIFPSCPEPGRRGFETGQGAVAQRPSGSVWGSLWFGSFHSKGEPIGDRSGLQKAARYLGSESSVQVVLQGRAGGSVPGRVHVAGSKTYVEIRSPSNKMRSFKHLLLLLNPGPSRGKPARPQVSPMWNQPEASLWRASGDPISRGSRPHAAVSHKGSGRTTEALTRTMKGQNDGP